MYNNNVSNAPTYTSFNYKFTAALYNPFKFWLEFLKYCARTDKYQDIQENIFINTAIVYLNTDNLKK